MLKLFGHPVSIHSRKAHFALEETGHPHSYQFVDLMTGEHRKPEYLAINPSGKVPVLQDGNFQLPESGAILRYLGEHYGNGKILPEDKQERARVDQWLFWQASEAGPTLMKPFYIQFMARMQGQQADEAAFQQAVQACDPVFEHLDSALAGKKFLVGSSLSIADIAIAESIFQLGMVGVSVSKFPNLDSWYKGINERDAFKKTRPPA